MTVSCFSDEVDEVALVPPPPVLKVPPAELRGLESAILRYPVIVRARLISVTYDLQRHAPTDILYRPVLLYRLRVLEYLDDIGYDDSEINAVRWTAGWSHGRKAASEWAEKLIEDRYDRFDDREAIVMLGDSGTSVGRYDRFYLAMVRPHYDDDHYSLSSQRSRHWFPATTPYPDGNTEFMLADPSGPPKSPWVRDTITLEELKMLIEEVAGEYNRYGDYQREVKDRYDELGQRRARGH